jgi:hypothetical protein
MTTHSSYELLNHDTSLLFAVENFHLHGVVTGARNSFGGDGGFEFRNLIRGELHIQGAEGFGDLRAGAGADYWN